MLIKHGVKKYKKWGIHLKTKAPCFHKTFGSISTLPPDFNYDSGLTNFNQNIPNPVFGTPAQPEGCTGMTTADVNTDADHIEYNPYFPYEKTCYIMNVPIGQPCDMTDALNAPQVYGLLALGENTDALALNHKKQAFSVNPIGGDLFQGIISAMYTKNCSVSLAGTWFSSFDQPVNGILPYPSGQTSGHNWKVCGLKTINGVPYAICKPWIGGNWGQSGFCYMSREILNKVGSEAFTFQPTTNANPVTRYTLLQTLLNYLMRLAALTGRNLGFI